MRWNDGVHPWFRRAQDYRRATLSYGDAMSQVRGPYVRRDVEAMSEDEETTYPLCNLVACGHPLDDHVYMLPCTNKREETCIACRRAMLPNEDELPHWMQPKGPMGRR